MAKFSLAVKPTFKAKVGIKVHGGEAVDVEFEFKHRTRDQLTEWLKGLDKRKDAEVLSDVLAGWALDDEFTPENIAILCQNFAGAPREIVDAYLGEISQARRKN